MLLLYWVRRLARRNEEWSCSWKYWRYPASRGIFDLLKSKFPHEFNIVRQDLKNWTRSTLAYFVGLRKCKNAWIDGKAAIPNSSRFSNGVSKIPFSSWISRRRATSSGLKCLEQITEPLDGSHLAPFVFTEWTRRCRVLGTIIAMKRYGMAYKNFGRKRNFSSFYRRFVRSVGFQPYTRLLCLDRN